MTDLNVFAGLLHFGPKSSHQGLRPVVGIEGRKWATVILFDDGARPIQRKIPRQDLRRLQPVNHTPRQAAMRFLRHKQKAGKLARETLIKIKEA